MGNTAQYTRFEQNEHYRLVFPLEGGELKYSFYHQITKKERKAGLVAH